jgi:peptidoglycan/xylan/chitin deacetylase (PgdA/CDA1 family)
MSAAVSDNYPDDRAHGLMFHHFWDDAGMHPKGQGAISAAEFESILRYLGVGRILPAREWARQAVTGTLPPEALCLTCDDALRCQRDVALPVMRDFGLTAFWFVPSAVCEGEPAYLEVFRYFRTVAFPSFEDFCAAFFDEVGARRIEVALRGVDVSRHLAEFDFYTDDDRKFRFVRDHVLTPTEYEEVMLRMIARKNFSLDKLAAKLWLTNADLRDLDAEGHVIGLHSYSHPTDLRSMPVEQQVAEYERNQAHLMRVLGKPVDTVSHPCNSYSEDTLNILRRLGVGLGFCARMVVPQLSMLEWPREDHIHLLAAAKSG